jgi:hypothetical protein
MSTVPESVAWRTHFLNQGYLLQDQFVSPETCTHLLDLVSQFQNQQDLELIHRAVRGRPLHYKVINGQQIASDIPEIDQLYRNLTTFVRLISSDDMEPLQETLVGVNVNVTPAGGTYRWHYDRNAVTLLLYLNEVHGGEIEIYPCFRIYLHGRGPAFVQRWLDWFVRLPVVRRLFGKKIVVAPAPGRMVAIRGNRSLHSVRPVQGEQERVNIVMAFDHEQNLKRSKQALDQYLYSQKPVSSDPNYTS